MWRFVDVARLDVCRVSAFRDLLRALADLRSNPHRSLLFSLLISVSFFCASCWRHYVEGVERIVLAEVITFDLGTQKCVNRPGV